MTDDQAKHDRLNRYLPAGRFSFGLREAIIVAIVCLAITFAAAYHYGT